MATPLISIIMPTFNAVEFISEAIESVIAQTYSDWELLIIDGDSTDGTIDTIKYYLLQDDRIKLYYDRPNQGIASARVKGLSIAQGEYIVPLGSDDIFMANRLEKQLKVIDHYYIVYSDYFKIDHHGQNMGIQHYPKIEAKNVTLDKVLINQFVPHDTMMARSNCYRHWSYRPINRQFLDDDHYLIAGWYKLGFSFHKMSTPILLKRYHANQHYRIHYDKYVTESAKLKELLK